MSPPYDEHQFDRSSFAVDGYIKRIEKPWGYELHWTRDNLPYMGKILHINAGKRLSLQAHDHKQESWFMMQGDALVIWEDETGNLVETKLVSGKGFTCAVGQRHRLVGVSDCDVIEVSTPEIGTTWRLEDDFARPDETPEQRELERR